MNLDEKMSHDIAMAQYKTVTDEWAERFLQNLTPEMGRVLALHPKDRDGIMLKLGVAIGEIPQLLMDAERAEPNEDIKPKQEAAKLQPFFAYKRNEILMHIAKASNSLMEGGLRSHPQREKIFEAITQSAFKAFDGQKQIPAAFEIRI